MRPSTAWASSAFLLASSVSAQQFFGGLLVEVTKNATCTRHSKAGDVLTMNYRGTLQSDGTQFDSSYGRGPFTFTLGASQVIQGWDKGLVGMCIGEGRNLTIPPAMAYGDRGVGGIPPGSTLIFETELLGIKGVKKEEPEPVKDVPENKIGPGESKNPPKHDGKGSEHGPKHGKEEENGECQLLGPFALIIQGALGLLAISSLVFKRWREKPRRPLKVWAFDASKQVFGSVLLHLANLLMSMFSSGDFDITQAANVDATVASTAGGNFVQDAVKDKPNPCSFYLLNLAIDTTIGIPILVVLLRLLHYAFSRTSLAQPEGSLRSGNYGQPPKVTWWLKQSMIYFLGLLGMKLCVFFIFQILPWLGWVGDWALRWTEGKAWVQITFVMLVFPLIMNGMQYYIIDSFIKDKEGPTEDSVGEHDGMEHEGLIGRRDSEEAEENAPLKEANPTAVPSYDSDEETRVEGGSSRGSTAKAARP